MGVGGGGGPGWGWRAEDVGDGRGGRGAASRLVHHGGSMPETPQQHTCKPDSSAGVGSTLGLGSTNPTEATAPGVTRRKRLSAQTQS